MAKCYFLAKLVHACSCCVLNCVYLKYLTKSKAKQVLFKTHIEGGKKAVKHRG